jgi:hypothetical protein
MLKHTIWLHNVFTQDAIWEHIKSQSWNVRKFEIFSKDVKNVLKVWHRIAGILIIIRYIIKLKCYISLRINKVLFYKVTVKSKYFRKAKKF